EWTTSRYFIWQTQIEHSKPRSERPTIGLGEEYGDASTETRELVSMRVRDPADEPLALESAQIISRLTTAVGLLHEQADSLDELTIRESCDKVTETDQTRQNCHHAGISKAKTWSIQTVFSDGRSGHLIEGGHIGGRLSVC